VAQRRRRAGGEYRRNIRRDGSFSLRRRKTAQSALASSAGDAKKHQIFFSAT
jgi:hypothetical protein